MGQWDWQTKAACASHDGDFFNEESTSTKATLALCATCPVIAPCLVHALEHEQWGVWGGTTARERVRLRRAGGLRYHQLAQSPRGRHW